jgi:hypothetical protein
MYQRVGWKAEINLKNDSYVLTLEDPHKNNIDILKDEVVGAALDSTDGRCALASAMVDPITTSLTYQSLIRRVLMVDELPVGQLPYYEYMEDNQPIYYTSQGIKSYNHNNDTLNDFTEIACNPTLPISEIKARRFYLVDRAQIKAKDSIQRQEDIILFSLLNKAATFEQTIYTYSETTHRAIEDSLVALENQDMVGAKIIAHPQSYRFIKKLPDFIEHTIRDVLKTGVQGQYQNLDVHVSTMCEKNVIYILPPAQFVGAFAINQNITVLPADDPLKLKIGWIVLERVFPTILNNEFVRKIIVKP